MKFKNKKCPICEGDFTPTSGRQKYCDSEVCQKEAANARWRNYYKNNKESEVERVSKANSENADKRKEYMKEYSQTEKFKASKRRHYQKNKEYYHDKIRERRAKEKLDKLQKSKGSSEEAQPD